MLLIPGSRIHASPRAWLAGSEQPCRLQDQNRQHFFSLFFIREMISNIWKSTCHVSCLNSDGKTIKVDAKYAFSQALSHFKFWLAGSMCSTGIHVKPSLQAPGGILEPSSWEQRKSTKARILKLMSQGNKLNKLYQSSCAHGIAGQQRGDRKRGAEWLSQGPAGTCQEGAVV